jgi:murein DD-endopeptidase MepM/ murein hydrolase activator NlpD
MSSNRWHESRSRWHERGPLALLLCTGLLLSLVGPPPASLHLGPTPPAGLVSAGFAPPSGGLAAPVELAAPVGFAPPVGLAPPVGFAAPVGLAPPAGLAGHALPGGGFRWPLDGAPLVVRPFDPPAQPWLAGHRGVDLAATPGATVRAAGAGQVRFAGWIAGRGVVSVDHANGLRTTYEPVEPGVRAGDRVSAGSPIGRLAPGHPGCTVAACLHWGLRRGDVYLDPLILLGLGQVRLLPLR